jgi:hypothetical protein
LAWLAHVVDLDFSMSIHSKQLRLSSIKDIVPGFGLAGAVQDTGESEGEIDHLLSCVASKILDETPVNVIG